jgi:hypothetical protein
MSYQTRKCTRVACMLPPLTAVLIAGCLTTPQQIEQRMDLLQPNALDAARERARLDLSCDRPIEAKVTSRKPLEPGLYALDRAEYKITASGCGRQVLLTVACSSERLCSALVQNAEVRSIEHK